MATITMDSPIKSVDFFPMGSVGTYKAKIHNELSQAEIKIKGYHSKIPFGKSVTSIRGQVMF